MPDKTFIDAVIAGEASDIDDWIARPKNGVFVDAEGFFMAGPAARLLGLTLPETVAVWHAADPAPIIETAVARRRAELAAQAPVVHLCGACKHLPETDGGGVIDKQPCGLCRAPAPFWAAKREIESDRIVRVTDGADCKSWEAKP